MSEVKLSYNLDLREDSTWLTVTANQTAKSSVAYIQEIGDFNCGPDYFTSREGLPSYLIKLCLSGEGTLEYNGSSYTIKPGSLFWIDCMQPQHYRTSQSVGNWHIVWVHLYGTTCQAYYSMFLSRNGNSPCISWVSDAAFKSIFDSLLRLYKDGGNTLYTDIIASGILTQLMTGCIQSAGRKDHSRSIPDYVADIQNLIDRDYMDNISLDSLARTFSINKYYLQKTFKRRMGLSPNEYLIYTRLTHAKELLRTTSMSIGLIGNSVGYSNFGYFIHLFRKYEGLTPGDYRKRWYNS